MVKGTKKAGKEEGEGALLRRALLSYFTAVTIQSLALCGSLITKYCNRSLQTDPDTFKNLINYKEGSRSKCTRTIGSGE